MVHIMFHSRHSKCRFVVDFLDFGVSLCTQDQCTIKFIMIQGNIVGILSFSSDLFQCSNMIDRFPNELLLTTVRGVR